MRSMGGCSKAEKNGSSIRKMAFLRKIPLCHHDSRKCRGCDADSVIPQHSLSQKPKTLPDPFRQLGIHHF